MIKKKERVYLSFTQYVKDRAKYNAKLANNEIEIFILSDEYPPLKLSLAEVS